MHIFMILCDELRSDALGYMGNETIKTPNIDQLATESVAFTNSYCNSPMCVPSRVSLATGRHAISHGAIDNMMRPFDDETSFYSMLQTAGYNTFNHGKWHSNVPPREFGIQYSNTGVQETCSPEKHISCFGINDPEVRQLTPHKRNQGDISLVLYGKRPTDKDQTLDSVVTDNYLADVGNISVGGQPTFARLSIMDPHTPYLPAEPYDSMYDPMQISMPESLNENLDSKPVLQRYFHHTRGFNQLNEQDYRHCKAAYSGLVSHVDERVGRVIKQLKQQGLYDDSLIIFTADHGSMLGEHGFVEKWGHMYEEVLRTPLLIKLPKGEAAGQVRSSFVESVDVMPTLLDLLELPIPENVQGKSLLPYIRQQTSQHKEAVYAQYFCGGLQQEPAIMVRDKRWKLTSYPEGNKLENYLLEDHPLRMSEFFDKPAVLGELYDLENDPNECNNLFDNPEYQGEQQYYLNKVNQWRDEITTVPMVSRTGQNTMGNYILLQGDNSYRTQQHISQENKLSQLKK